MTDILYDLLYMIPLCLLVTILGEPGFGGPEKSIFTYLLALAMLGICVVFKHWKNRLKYLIPGMLLALGAGLLLIRSPEKWGELLWNSQWILWVTLSALGSFFVGWLWSANRRARRIFSAALLLALILIMIFLRTPNKAEVDLAMFLLAVFVADEIQHYWKKSGYLNPKGHMVSIAPFLAALGLIVFLLPAPDDPYDWRFAVRLWENAAGYVKLTGRWFHRADEDYGAVIGFSEDGNFWGNLSKRDKTVMTMTGKNDLGSVVYLRGKVMDHFDGRYWTATYEGENRDDMLDTLETLCGVTCYDPDYVRNYLWRVELGIQYQEFNTQYFFTPLKPVLGWLKIGENAYSQQGGSLLSAEKLGYGTEYKVTFYRANRDHAGYQEFLRNAGEPDAETWDVVRTKYEPLDVVKQLQDGGRWDAPGTTYEDYLAYRSRMKEYYLQETKLPERVDDYLQKLLEGAGSDFDKLNRIESFLSSLTYTVSPGSLPEEVTTPEAFLEYFLLKKQEGYCTHFATAFVLLARSQGIPARYVQGFYVRRNDAETVEVKSDMAHAWPEAYLDGIGWVAFEPTPGWKAQSSWAFQTKVKDPGPGAEPERKAPENVPGVERMELEPEPEEPVRIRWGVILLPIGLSVLFLLAFLLVDRLLTLARYRRLDEEGKFQTICKKNFGILGFLGYAPGRGETLEEFWRRLCGELGEDAPGFLRELELVAYAGKRPDESSLALAMGNYKVLMEHLKTAKGKWFFWYRYRIARMEAEKKKDKRKETKVG